MHVLYSIYMLHMTREALYGNIRLILNMNHLLSGNKTDITL